MKKITILTIAVMVVVILLGLIAGKDNAVITNGNKTTTASASTGQTIPTMQVDVMVVHNKWDELRLMDNPHLRCEEFVYLWQRLSRAMETNTPDDFTVEDVTGGRYDWSIDTKNVIYLAGDYMIFTKDVPVEIINELNIPNVTDYPFAWDIWKETSVTFYLEGYGEWETPVRLAVSYEREVQVKFLRSENPDMFAYMFGRIMKGDHFILYNNRVDYWGIHRYENIDTRTVSRTDDMASELIFRTTVHRFFLQKYDELGLSVTENFGQLKLAWHVRDTEWFWRNVWDISTELEKTYLRFYDRNEYDNLTEMLNTQHHLLFQLQEALDYQQAVYSRDLLGNQQDIIDDLKNLMNDQQSSQQENLDNLQAVIDSLQVVLNTQFNTQGMLLNAKTIFIMCASFICGAAVCITCVFLMRKYFIKN